MMLDIDAFELGLEERGSAMMRLPQGGRVYLIIWQGIRASLVGMISSPVLELIIQNAGSDGSGVEVAEKAA